MNNCLNLFQISDISSLPEQPHQCINYYTIDNKFNLLEIDLSTGDKTAISVAKELARSFLSSIVYLLRSELRNVIRYDSGLQIFSNATHDDENVKLEINSDTKNNYDSLLQWKNLRVNLIFTSEYEAKTKPSPDIFDDVSEIFLEIYNNDISNDEKSSVFTSTSLSKAASEKASLWKLCYATFYLNYVNSLVGGRKSKIIIPFNNADVQMTILQDLFSNVTFNRKFASRYNNTRWTFRIWGETSALYSELIAINDNIEIIISEVSSCNNCIDELPLVNIVTNSYVS